MNNFKKKKKKPGQGASKSESKLSKTSTKAVDIATDFDKLLSWDMLENYPVFKAVAKNLEMTRSLKFLQFWAVRLSGKSWEVLCDGIAKNSTIGILSLNAWGINNVAFECLVPALQKNTSLEILDMSYNYMGDEMAWYIAKIISNQSERRDNVVWLAGLRGEAPNNEEYKSGLQSIILRYNDFKNYICGEISRVLLYDIYIKSIDLRNNDIDEKGIKDMWNFLKSNKTILNCDLRYNIGFSSKLHRDIVFYLLRNLKLAKLDPKIDCKKWANMDSLTIEIPESMVPEVQAKIHSLFTHSENENTPIKQMMKLTGSKKRSSSNK